MSSKLFKKLGLNVIKVARGRKSRYKGQNRSDFDHNKKRQTIHENEALYVIFSKKIISRANKVT